MRRNGYAIAHSSVGWPGSTCGGSEDLCLDGALSPVIHLDEVSRAIIYMTPLRFLFGLSTVLGRTETLRRALFSLDALYSHQPFFLFVHSLSSRPPFSKTADCRDRVSRDTPTEWSDKKGYLDAILCTNLQLLQLVDAIVARDPEAIIIVQADHGSLFSWSLDDPNTEWTQDMSDERFPVLLAIRAPKDCKAWITPTLSNVNTMGLIAGCLQGIKPQYLPDHFYITDYSGNVQELTQGPKQ